MIAKTHPYFKQAKLMLEILSFVAEEKCFALKGGTAINFFLRDMPRLSVDIDLTYLPIEDRNTSLNNITSALQRIAKQLKRSSQLQIKEKVLSNSNIITKLYITDFESQVIIEPNLTIRGSSFPVKIKRVVSRVEEYFGASVSMNVVAAGDLYGGKICAALDRQHPRDLYDVKILFDNEGITEEIRKGIIIHFASHDAAISQLLDPTRKDISVTYNTHFEGMTSEAVTLKQLIETREMLIAAVQLSLTREEREFLLTLKQGNPQWKLIGVPNVDKLPAIQWKLANIKKMSPSHHHDSVEKLKNLLKL